MTQCQHQTPSRRFFRGTPARSAVRPQEGLCQVSRGNANFRKSDIRRAVQVLKDLGAKNVHIEIEAGKAKLVPQFDSTEADATDLVELDSWLAKKNK